MRSAMPHTHSGAPVLPLVGRARELAVLREHFAAALDGQGSLVLVGGEEGIGKSTLLNALSDEARAQGALVLAGYSYDHAYPPTYGLWSDLVERYPSGADLPPLPEPLAQLDSAAAPASREMPLTAVRESLATLARQRPLVLLLEDLHWADESSLDLLRHAAHYLATLPLLIIGSFRSTELVRDYPLRVLLPILGREAAAERLDLAGLAEEDTVELVTARYRLATGDVRRLASYLHARAEGNPLLMVELLRTMEESGQLCETSEGWQLGGLPRVGLPRLLRELLDSRLSRLSDDDRRLLAIAATFGQEVSLESWAVVAGVAEEALLDTVERVAGLNLLTATLDGMRVRFVHALYRDGCLDSALPTRRRAWHRRIGEHLASSARPDPHQVAHHFQQAGDRRAAEWLVKAGDRAYLSFAYPIAVERYETAEALLDTDAVQQRNWLHYRLARALRYLDAPRARAMLVEAAQGAATAGDRGLAALVLYNRGQEQYLAGEDDLGFANTVAGAEGLLALSPEEQARLGQHSDVTGLVEVSDCLAPLAGYLAYHGHFARALELVERCGALGAEPVPGGPRRAALLAEAKVALGQLYTAQGRPLDARRELALARDAFLGPRFYFSYCYTATFYYLHVHLPYFTDEVAARQKLSADVERVCSQAAEDGLLPLPAFFRAPFLMAAGDWTAARTLASDAIDRAHFISVLRAARHLLAPLARDQGEPDLAWQQIFAQLPAGTDAEPGTVPLRYALAAQHLAVALALDAGDLPAAGLWLKAASRWLGWSGATLWRSEHRLLWARYHHVDGHSERAYATAIEAVAAASTPRQPLALLAAHRFLGELATNIGRLRDAATHLAAALPLADACAIPHERALTLLALAELRAAEGRSGDAIPTLDAARVIGKALGAVPMLARADALAARLAAPNLHAAQPAGLSSREIEVLRLIAGGKSNQEIADALFLSGRTVEVHIRHIYTKADVPNRAAAVAFALRHGLM